MEYEGLNSLAESFPDSHDATKPETFKLFIIGEDSDARYKGCETVKIVLDQMFERAEEDWDIKEYKTEIIDLSNRRNFQYALEADSPGYWDDAGNLGGNILVPILHNAGNFPDLPQILFDRNRPGILSLSQGDYANVANTSKRDRYDVVRV